MNYLLLISIVIAGIFILYKWVSYTYSHKNVLLHSIIAVIQIIGVVFIAEIVAAIVLSIITRYNIMPIEALFLLSLITKYNILPIEAVIDAIILSLLSAVFIYYLVIRPFNSRIKRYTKLVSNITENTLDGIITINEEGLIESFNLAAEKMFGYKSNEIEGQHIGLIIPMISQEMPNEFKAWAEYSLDSVKEGLVRKHDDSVFHVQVALSKMVIDNKAIYIGIFRDISKVKEAEAKEEQLSHILKAINEINQLIVREKDPEALLQQVCEILIKTRDYQLAWIGFIEEDSYNIEPVAEAGIAQSYVNSIKIMWDDSEYSDNPTGMAVKSRKTVVKHIGAEEKDDPNYAEIAQKYGLKSICAIPVMDQERFFGALTVYSIDDFRFNEQEVSMLEELSSDVAFCLHNIEEVFKKEQAESSLIENEEKFRKLFDDNPDSVFITDMDGCYIDANKVWLASSGYAKSEIIGKSLAEIGLWSPEEHEHFMQELGEHDGVENMEFKLHTKSGGEINALVSAHIIELNGEKAISYVIRDITELRKIEKKLQRNEEMFRLISENAADLISIVDKNGKRIYSSPSYTTNLGYSREELASDSPFDIVHADDRSKMKQAFTEAINTGIGSTIEYRVKDKNGTFRVLESRCSIIKNPEGEVENLVLVARDITERKQNEEMLIHKTYHDDLTNLPNRILFKDRLNQALIVAKRDKHKLSVLFIDLDRFKSVNDTLGHTIGDILLQKVANVLSSCLRETDTIARQGGDEFIILLPKIDDINDAIFAANRIIELFHEPFLISEQEIFITASIGISIYPTDGKDDETLIRRADMAMYRAKEAGRAGYQMYSDTMEENIKKLVLENSIRKGLKQDEFVLYYQPQIDLKTSKLHGFEALIRWNHPDLGLVLPSNFISLAEESGLIVPVGEWIFREACTQLKSWQSSGYKDLIMMVNLSGRQFAQKNLLKSIVSILKESKINPKHLEFEVTESVIMRDIDFTISVLKEFRNLGINSTIDDFGTGYSSLNYLRKLPVSMLKIDKSFIAELPDDRESAVIVSATIALAHSLNLKVIAEGVETIDQLQFLRSQECDYAQGYLFSEAMSHKDIEHILADQSKWEKHYLSKMH